MSEISKVLAAYTERTPNPGEVSEKVVFGTSGHRGCSLKGSFNRDHILAITQAVVGWRRKQGITGPLYVGKDTHALSGPAMESVLEVLSGNSVPVRVDSGEGYTPTPLVSHAILRHNATGTAEQADGLIITPSRNRRKTESNYNGPDEKCRRIRMPRAGLKIAPTSCWRLTWRRFAPHPGPLRWQKPRIGIT